jgi:hypothetical protein
VNSGIPGMISGTPKVSLGTPGTIPGRPKMIPGTPGVSLGTPKMTPGQPGMIFGTPKMSLGRPGMSPGRPEHRVRECRSKSCAPERVADAGHARKAIGAAAIIIYVGYAFGKSVSAGRSGVENRKRGCC